MGTVEQRQWAIEQAIMWGRVYAEHGSQGRIRVESIADSFLNYILRQPPADASDQEVS
jgi:ribosomal 30S subunit maturation factor RimM